jgi:hypothetical protein
MRNKFRFLLFGVLCLMALTLDSCSGDTTYKDTNVPAVVTVSYNSGSVTLVDASGNTYIPTSTSFVSNGTTYSITSANDGHLAYIVYDLKTNGSSSSSYKVTLSYFKDIDTYYHNQVIYTTKGAADDSVSNIKSANDSLVSVDGVSIMGTSSSINTQLLALLDYCPGTTSYNTVVCYTNQGLTSSSTTTAFDTLKVWLCHHAMGSIYSYTTYDWSKTYPYLYYFGFNLEKAISLAANETSKDTVIVDLKARIASSSTSVAWKGYCCKARVH